ncbi:MAG: DNA-binding protein [Planctomycetota bacterium]|nr:MAG: DNA-binding protein [Planctomycetota bacterium]REK25944.1 MAG: DNA-binding protein [Planctomycetota bacterium]REK46939.1 MAG: DNA-binding protein [Planctomycetota bacterium]
MIDPSSECGPFTVAEIAARYRIGVSTVYAAIRAGELEAHRIGPRKGNYRITVDAANRWWDQCRTPVTNELPATSKCTSRGKTQSSHAGFRHLRHRRRTEGVL